MSTYPNYEKVGRDIVYQNANAPLDIYQGGYFFEENVRMEFFTSTIYISDLTNAMKTGKDCFRWVYTRDDWSGNFLDLYCDLTNQGLKTFTDILKAEQIVGYSRGDDILKSIRTFSPFTPVKPIKPPKKWTTAHMAKGILTGQIYHGVTEQHLTDDYALDAADNFGKGAAVDLISIARKFIEDAGSGIYISPTEKEDGTFELSVSTYSYDFKNYLFDEKCNWEIKAKRLAQIEKDLEESNQKILAQVLEVDLAEITDDVVYRVTTIEKEVNTGIYKEKIQLMYPESLRRSAELELQITKIERTPVENEALYQISSLRTPARTTDIKDFRFIGVGGGSTMVTGFALKELLADHKRFPVLEKLSLTISAQKELLEKTIEGTYWCFSDLGNTDFSPEDSLLRLTQEELRIPTERR